jgi:hypothetical protein
MAVYGTSVFARQTIGVMVGGTVGSLEISNGVGGGLPFVAGDYIGIYVEVGIGTPPVAVIVEGTLYVSIA